VWDHALEEMPANALIHNAAETEMLWDCPLEETMVWDLVGTRVWELVVPHALEETPENALIHNAAETEMHWDCPGD